MNREIRNIINKKPIPMTKGDISNSTMQDGDVIFLKGRSGI